MIASRNPWRSQSARRSVTPSASRSTGTTTSSMSTAVPDARIPPTDGKRPLRSRQCESRTDGVGAEVGAVSRRKGASAARARASGRLQRGRVRLAELGEQRRRALLDRERVLALVLPASGATPRP